MSTNPLWVLWILIAFALSIPPFLWHAEIFRTHSPAVIVPWLPAVPLILIAILFGLHRVRPRTPARWEPALILAPALVVCLIKVPWPTLLAFCFFLSAHGFGTRLVDAANPLERISLRFALGSGFLMLTLAGLGLARLLNPVSATILLIAPIALNRPLLEDAAALLEQWTHIEDLRGAVMTMVLSFGAIFAAMGTLWAITPVIAFDPLKMHLVSVRWYATTGTFSPLPSTPESYYPQGTELLMTLLWLPAGGQAAAQLLNPVFLAATLVLLVALLRRIGLTRQAAVAGAVAAATLPFVHWTAFVAKNDFPLALFLLASLACLIDRRPLLATVFLSFAFAVKHVALFGAIALAPLFLWRVWESAHRLRTAAAVAAIFSTLGILSLLRTYLLTGNPLYPESTARTTDFSVVNHPHRDTYERVLRYAGIPWLLHFDGRRAFESTTHNPMGTWLVFFWLAWLPFLPRRNTAASLALLFCAIYLLYWVSILVTLRYAIAPLLILAGLSATALFTLPRWLTLPAGFFCFFFSLTVCTLLEITAPQLAWFAGRLDRHQFLKQALPSYGVVHALEGKVDRRDTVFALENCATAYAPYPERFHCAYLRDLGDSPLRAAARIHRLAPTFFILPNDDAAQAILATTPATPVYRDENYSLYLFHRPAVGVR